MDADHVQRVLDVLETEGPTMPIVVLARHLGLAPSRLVGTLDDLFDAGIVTPGKERGTVSLVPQPQADGRFHSAARAERVRR